MWVSIDGGGGGGHYAREKPSNIFLLIVGFKMEIDRTGLGTGNTKTIAVETAVLSRCIQDPSHNLNFQTHKTCMVPNLHPKRKVTQV